MGYHSKKNNYNFKNQFYYLLISIIILCINIESKNKKLSLINNNSQIKITFANNGVNKFFSEHYISKPSSIGLPSICDLNELICNIQNNTKTITLYFEDIQINSCEKMFQNLDNIIEIDLSNFNASGVTYMNSMFSGCSNLKKIIFGNMDTSKVETMNSLFYNCIKLESLDLSNFDTYLVSDMRRMFSNLHSLVYLKLSNKFNTSNVMYMDEMFSNIWSLTSIDLSMFNTLNVNNMSSMFSGAKKLKILNISNFVPSKCFSINNMFAGCDELQYLDIRKFDLFMFENVVNAFPFNNKFFILFNLFNFFF